MQKLTLIAVFFVGILSTAALGYTIYDLDYQKIGDNQSDTLAMDNNTNTPQDNSDDNNNETSTTNTSTPNTQTGTSQTNNTQENTGMLKTNSGEIQSGQIPSTNTGTKSSTGSAQTKQSWAFTTQSGQSLSGKTSPNADKFERIPAEKTALNTYLENNDYEQAASVYETLLTLEPNNIRLHREGVKMMLLKLKDFERALQYAQSFAQENKNSAIAHNSLGWAHLKSNNLEEAKEALFTATAIDPSLPEIYLNLGDVYGMQDETHKAKSYYEECIKRDWENGAIGKLAAQALNNLD